MSGNKLPVYMKPEDWAKAYEKGAPHWTESQEPLAFAPQLLEMLGKKSGNRILEIGAGDGVDSI